jgi:hypothetical protein
MIRSRDFVQPRRFLPPTIVANIRPQNKGKSRTTDGAGREYSFFDFAVYFSRQRFHLTEFISWEYTLASNGGKCEGFGQRRVYLGRGDHDRMNHGQYTE